MAEVEAVILVELSRLAPLGGFADADWDEVVRRAGLDGAGGSVRTKRRLIIALAVLAALLIPLVAVGAVNDWWFFKNGYAPTPTSSPVVVKVGTWAGRPWELVAYRSTTDGLCFAVTATNSTTPGAPGLGAAMGCAPFVGIARTKETKATPEMTITYMSRAGNKQFPAYVAGPVISRASQVEIRFTDGQILRVPTFAAPTSLGRVRFYATPLPTHEFVPKSVAGLDSNGNVIACLVPGKALDGISPLSACK
jgi:hypothetical protein